MEEEEEKANKFAMRLDSTRLNPTTAELHNFIYPSNLCIPSEVYDYGSHNSAPPRPTRAALTRRTLRCSNGRPVGGISETLIRSKCTGIILFVYYVPVRATPSHGGLSGPA